MATARKLATRLHKFLQINLHYVYYDATYELQWLPYDKIGLLTTPENAEIRDTHVTGFIFTIYASTDRESKVMNNKKMYASYGSLCLSLDSPTVILARKFLNSDLRGSLTLPHCGSLQAVVKSSKSIV